MVLKTPYVICNRILAWNWWIFVDKMTKNKSVMKQMESVEEILKGALERVDNLEQRLRSKLLTAENREKIEKELDQVRANLKENEEKLAKLRQENTKSFMVAACLVFGCFLIFGLYSMLFNNF